MLESENEVNNKYFIKSDKAEHQKIIQAAFDKDLDFFKFYLDYKTKEKLPNIKVTHVGREWWRPIENVTLMHLFALTGFNEAIELLLSKHKNYDLNKSTGSKKGYTPLLLALRHNHFETAKILLESGANPNSSYKSQVEEGDLVYIWTPLGILINNESCPEEESLEIIKLLIEKGANIEQSYFLTSDEIGTPLMDALLEEKSKIAALLLENGADINAKNGEVLTYALYPWADPDIFTEFLKYKPNTDNLFKSLCKAITFIGDKGDEDKINFIKKINELIKYGAFNKPISDKEDKGFLFNVIYYLDALNIKELLKGGRFDLNIKKSLSYIDPTNEIDIFKYMEYLKSEESRSSHDIKEIMDILVFYKEFTNICSGQEYNKDIINFTDPKFDSEFFKDLLLSKLQISNETLSTPLNRALLDNQLDSYYEAIKSADNLDESIKSEFDNIKYDLFKEVREKLHDSSLFNNQAIDPLNKEAYEDLITLERNLVLEIDPDYFAIIDYNSKSIDDRATYYPKGIPTNYQGILSKLGLQGLDPKGNMQEYEKFGQGKIILNFLNKTLIDNRNAPPTVSKDLAIPFINIYGFKGDIETLFNKVKYLLPEAYQIKGRIFLCLIQREYSTLSYNILQSYHKENMEHEKKLEKANSLKRKAEETLKNKIAEIKKAKLEGKPVNAEEALKALLESVEDPTEPMAVQPSAATDHQHDHSMDPIGLTPDHS
jgi:hypothetical protein